MQENDLITKPLLYRLSYGGVLDAASRAMLHGAAYSRDSKGFTLAGKRSRGSIADARCRAWPQRFAPQLVGE